MSADAAGAGEKIHDAVGAGIGGDIEVLGFQSKEQIPHTSAHQICLVSCAVQLGDHLVRESLRVHIPMLI